ncbi:MAG: molybdenum cofactor guanylyltransferase [Armatimonadota bacterium]|nr:molybdenum cofactor guanylyltransferase [Armatimonadota bacterium]MDW8156590.1 molybdenum cofactor guanylyltransferase [Armatimonadota bacterium]
MSGYRAGERLGGVVLAGGRSRRMGTDKALLPFAGTTLLGHVVRRIRTCCNPVYVVASDPRRDFGLRVPVVADRWPGHGPVAGIEAGLRACPTPCAAVVACDLPFVQPALLAGLADLMEGVDAAVPLTDRPHPLCAVYRRDAAYAAEAVLEAGGGSVRHLLARIRVRYVPEEVLRPWDPDLLSFVNVNTPADYAAALARLRPGAGPTAR